MTWARLIAHVVPARLRPPPADPVVALRAEVEAALRRRLAWVSGSPCAEPTWEQVVAETSDYLLGLWREGRLVGRVRPDAFFVRCDRTTMTQTDVDAGRVVVLAGFAVRAPAEFEAVLLELQAAP